MLAFCVFILLCPFELKNIEWWPLAFFWCRDALAIGQDRERGRLQTDRQRQRDRQTDTDRQAGRQADRATERYIQTDRHRQTGRQTERQAGRQAETDTDRQAGRERQTDRQTKRDRESYSFVYCAMTTAEQVASAIKTIVTSADQTVSPLSTPWFSWLLRTLQQTVVPPDKQHDGSSE